MVYIKLRLAPWLIGSIILLALSMFDTAVAVEVHCIEESKYKYLYQLFGEDPRKFAAYLEIDRDRYHLPDPETCRAVLVSGGIGEPNDREKLLDFVARSKGWLAAVYLNSGGGSVWAGQQLGYIVRAFRLKTFTAHNAGNKIFYEPDFAVAPLSPTDLALTAGKDAAIAAEGQAKPPRCGLHEHVPTPQNAPDIVSGIMRPETFTPTYEENIDHPGGDFRVVEPPTNDPRACQRLCMNDANCRAWAYRKPNGADIDHPRCSLKQRVLARVSDKLSVAGITRADTPDATYQDNIDLPGSDYREFDLAKAEPGSCQSACLGEARCRAWVYRKPEGRTNHQPHCWLKQSVPSVMRTDNLVVSGTVIRLQYAEPTFEENIDLAGSDYREFDLAKAEPRLCQSACLGEARCRAWAYRKPEGRTNNRPHCWLKEHVPSVKKTDNLTVAGIRPGAFEPIYENDVDRPGQEYRSRNLPAPDPRLCQKSCADDAGCRAWVYEKPNAAFIISLASGWDAYRARQRSILSIPSPGNNWCASSCVQIQVAGLDRSGVVQVHRPNQGWTAMSQQAEALNMNDAHMPQFYQYMDAGPRVTWLMKETSATTVTPTFASRFPRYVLDYLIVHCGVDPEQLQNLEEQLKATLKELAPSPADVSLKVDRLRATLGKLHDRRRRAEQCVAKAQEQDRLAAYNALCGNSCDEKKLGADFDAAVWKISAQHP